MGTEQRKTYTVDEAAQLLGVNRKGVYDEIKGGNFPHVRIGKRILIPRTALDRWLEEASRGKAS